MLRTTVVMLGMLIVGPGCRAKDRDGTESHEQARTCAHGHENGGARNCDCDRDCEPAVAAPVDPPLDEQFLTAYLATSGFTLGVPVPVAITPDGAVVFRRTPPRDPKGELFQLDVGGGTRLIAKADECPSQFARTEGVVPVNASDDGARILVYAGDGACVVGLGTPIVGVTPFNSSPHDDEGLSPDGKRVAFLVDDDLGSLLVDEPWSTVLARHPQDRSLGDHTYGLPEITARDFGRERGYWWSPDSQSIVFQRTDAHAVESIEIPYPNQPTRHPRTKPYARAGGAIPVVDLGVVSVRGGAPTWVRWDHARFPYLAKVIWVAHAPLTLVVVSRDQTELAVLRVDVATGKTQVVLSERDPAWVDIAPNRLTWLDDGSGFLWMSEMAGAWTLSHYRANGTKVRDVVAADVGLRDVAGVTPEGEVIVMAAADPREQHVWRVPLAGGAPVALTSGGGVHTAMTRYGVVVVTSILRDGGTTVTAIRGNVRREVPGAAERPALVPTTVIEELQVGDHRQYVAITRPRAFDRRRRYPVLVNVAGDPAHKAVVDARDTYLLDQWIADAGFIVLRSDGRGTPDRGRDFQRAISGDVTTLPLADQIGGLAAACAVHPEFDRAHVGVFGTGFGGYVATMAVLQHPEVFAAASATTPILDWGWFRVAYAERYLKLPEANADGYRRANALGYADKLTRPLLVVQKLAYDVEASTVRAFVGATAPAHKLVELVDLPFTPDDRVTETVRVRAPVEFFRRQLAVH